MLSVNEYPTWHMERDGVRYAGCGARSLLDVPLTAFFSSRRCPGDAIRTAMDWALEQARNRQPVIGGFHAPLEQSVLALLLQARSPVVVVLARPVAGVRFAASSREAIAQGRMVVISSATQKLRLTQAIAARRNEEVCALATRIVVAHASPRGHLEGLCDRVRTSGKELRHWMSVPT